MTAKNPIHETTEKYPYKSAFSLFSESKELVMQNLQPFLILSAIPFLFAVVSRRHGNSQDLADTGVSSLSGTGMAVLAGVGLTLLILSIIIGAFVQVMMYVLAKETAHGKKPTLDQVYALAIKNWRRIILLELEIAVRVLVGLVLLIIPGLKAIRKYFLAPYAMLDKDLSPKQAMAESERLSTPYTGAIWGLIGVSILIGISSAIPTIIGAFIAAVLGMFFAVAPALRYFELKKLVKEPGNSEPKPVE